MELPLRYVSVPFSFDIKADIPLVLHQDMSLQALCIATYTLNLSSGPVEAGLDQTLCTLVCINAQVASSL